MFAEVADGVVAMTHRVVEGKAALVFGTDSVLAVDACNDPADGRAMVGAARARGRRVDRLVYTHGHGDHVLGSGAFDQAVVFAHADATERMQATVAQTAARESRSVEDVTRDVRWPQVWSRSGFELDLGRKQVVVLPTSGHTSDSVCAYVVEDRVLITGDTVVTCIVPSIADGDSGELEATLRGLLGLDIVVLIPGHGPVVHGAKQIQDRLRWEATYLRAVRDLVAAHPGDSEDELFETLGVDAYVGGRFPVDRYRMADRHRNVIRKVMAELQPPE